MVRHKDTFWSTPMELAILPNYLRIEKIKSLENPRVTEKKNPWDILLARLKTSEVTFYSPVDGLVTTENSLDFSEYACVYTHMTNEFEWNPQWPAIL